MLLLGSEGAPLPAPPAELALDPFYKKHLDCAGLPIVASEKVPDAALHEARRLVLKMVEKRPEALPAIVRAKVRVAVMAKSEVTTDIPEHATLSPKDYWDKRARGLGATRARPAVSGAEENLLGHDDDRYRGESIFIHEFAHTLHKFGAAALESDFDARLRAAYEAAIEKGLWKETYAAENPSEYWAEGVQSWFDANIEGSAPGLSPGDPSKGKSSIHNDVDTREELRRYDPALAALIAEWLPDDDWRYAPPSPPASGEAKQ
jgi:hypothetical protein